MLSFKPQAFALFITLSIGLASCGPIAQSKQTQTTTPASTTLTTSQAASSKPATTTNSPKTPGSSLSTAASVSSGSPSFVNLRSGDGRSIATPATDSADTTDAFDGKNPFADDSLWQIPVHLVRDLSSSSNEDALSKSASETNSAADSSGSDDGDIESLDEPEAPASSGGYTQSSSSAPTIISASTDLKTAAGYHYPSSHGGHHGYHGSHSPSYAGHQASHYGDSGHGDHYGGKYFQYASVPYPYAWDFGYKRGNPYHTIERYEHGKGPHFQTKVKWSDKYGGYGVHVWDYNHDDHQSHHYGGGDHHDGYEAHGPSHHGSGHYGSGHYGHH